MSEVLPILARGSVLVVLFATLIFGLSYCGSEDHRHTEEMRRLQMIEQGCLEESP